MNNSNHHDERSTSYHIEPPKKVKFEPIPPKNTAEINQDSLIRHLQNRISDLRDDNIRLRDSQQSKSILSSSYHEVKKIVNLIIRIILFLYSHFRMIIKIHSLPYVQGIKYKILFKFQKNDPVFFF